MEVVEKPDRVRRLVAVETAALRQQVARLSERVWRKESDCRENDYPCFGHTRHIIFRLVPRTAAAMCWYSNPSWRVWSKVLLPLMDRVAALYGYSQPVYPKAMLARLAAGYGIDTHVDNGHLNPYTHKIHVPLETNPQALLTVDGEVLHLQAGYAWEVNNLAPHGAFNGGAHDRVHFIFEVTEGAGTQWVEHRMAPRAVRRRGIIVPAKETARSNFGASEALEAAALPSAPPPPPPPPR